MKNIKIVVATHKEYQMPDEDIYIPVLVGANNKKRIQGYTLDNEGDNISSKNPSFCELTALYWAWKNLDADYIGVSHYRRYFSVMRNISRNEKKKFKQVLTENQIKRILTKEKVDVILPKKREYFISDLYQHYKNTLYIEPLDETRKIIEEKYPEYLEEFDKIHKRTSAHMFNMFVMKKEILNEYCEWLFDILFELEKRMNETKYDNFHGRFYGRVSEILLDIWINKNNIKYEEVKVIDMQHINWIKKGFAFLQATLVGKKYEESF